jgi:hypothetical protein
MGGGGWGLGVWGCMCMYNECLLYPLPPSPHPIPPAPFPRSPHPLALFSFNASDHGHVVAELWPPQIASPICSQYGLQGILPLLPPLSLGCHRTREGTSPLFPQGELCFKVMTRVGACWAGHNCEKRKIKTILNYLLRI